MGQSSPTDISILATPKASALEPLGYRRARFLSLSLGLPGEGRTIGRLGYRV